MRNVSIILALIIYLFSSCTKDEHIDKEPSFAITVSDENGNKLKGVVVVLYDNYHDWYETINPLHSGITNEAGEVLFENLKEIVYYFDASYAETHCNYPDGIYRTEQPLSKGVLKALSITIHEH